MLRGSLARKIDELRYRKAVREERKTRESSQKTGFQMAQERKRIAALEEKRRLQKLKEKRYSLERKTGSGVRGFLARTGQARKRMKSAGSGMATAQIRAAYSVAGLKAPTQKRRKPRKRGRKTYPYRIVYR